MRTRFQRAQAAFDRRQRASSIQVTSEDLEVRRIEKASRRAERLRRKDHASRARRAAAPIIDRFTLHDIIERDGPTCYLCGHTPRGTDQHLEHIIALANGGEHSLANAALACSACNTRKGVRAVAFVITTRRPQLLARPR